MAQALPQSTLHKNVRVVPVEPHVKSAKTCKLFNTGVSGKTKTKKSADPTCYNAATVEIMTGLFDNVEMEMKFTDQRCELPWAVPKKPGYTGEASGLYFYFYATEQEAKKGHAALKRQGKWTDDVRYMPGEAYRLGSFAL